VDCPADRPFAETRGVIDRLLALRQERVGDSGMAVPWIVPRLARCDASYAEIEEFVNTSVVACGWATLDPQSAVRVGERIGPLPLPVSARARMTRARSIA
jgi:hypothetical protein